MPQTVPTPDLITGKLNKTGVSYDAAGVRLFYAEEYAAIYGRLVGGTYSVNARDYWAGGTQVIDSTRNWLGATIPVTKGGTGLTSCATGDILYGSASNTLSALSVGSTNQVLAVVGGVPSWQTGLTFASGDISGTAGPGGFQISDAASGITMTADYAAVSLGVGLLNPGETAYLETDRLRLNLAGATAKLIDLDMGYSDGPRLRMTATGNKSVELRASADRPTVGLYVDGLRVVGEQQSAIANATGAGDVVAQLNSALAALRTHGLIAT